MSDPQAPKDDTFLRKVARFVANPATDWADLNAINEEGRDLELEKSELKAMIERKRRNDFVRRREFEMLRRVRREGLSPEQLAALGGSSRIDDPDSRMTLPPPMQRGGDVKDKIDAIEKQMVGGGTRPTPLDSPPPPRHADPNIATTPAVMGRAMNHAKPPRRVPTLSPADEEELLPALPPLPPEEDGDGAHASGANGAGAPLRATPAPRKAARAESNPTSGPGLPPLSRQPRQSMMMELTSSYESVEVGEVVHDPELDPAVIAFANADFDDCERMLTGLTKPGGRRADHAETWLVLFDLFRGVGQQAKFEALALDYAQQFGWSAPQWFSLPKLVAEAAASAPASRGPLAKGQVGWVCPAELMPEAVARLDSISLQLPLPWVFDWTPLRTVDVKAADDLSKLMRRWANQDVEMRWLNGERFFDVLGQQAPNGVRDADPAFWITRLEALRLANNPDRFDEMAIDYCVTYEVSPPSWEKCKALVKLTGAGLTTQSPALLQVSGGAPRSTMQDSDSVDTVRVAEVDLSGQLVGDIAATLSRMDDQLDDATVVKVSCARLIRVDFVAAGDLLNWVLAKRKEGRSITMVDTHRLVALFFGAMGITEHASVRVRLV
jgi:ABC-type transporter Mla MlaB component